MEKKEPTPSGLDTVKIAKDMSRIKAHRYAFGYFDTEDISQEIWLMVNKAADKYDADRTDNPKSFFNVITENALRNLRRDTRIVDNINIHDRPIEQLDNSFEEFIELRDLVEYLIVNIPPKLKSALEIMINQESNDLPSYLKTKVRNAVSRLMEKWRNE